MPDSKIKNLPASIRQKLLNLAQERNDDFGLVLTKYGLERMLFRLTRRQFTKFLTLASLGMFVGNLWILAKAYFAKTPSFPSVAVGEAGEIPVGSVKLFTYPTPRDHCILVRTGEEEYVAYSQKCTHLSCAVYFSAKEDRLECPCHNGSFSVRDGSVLQGPPPRPLPQIILERDGAKLVALGVKGS